MTLKKLFFTVLATSAIISSSLSAETIVQILSQEEPCNREEEEVIKEKVSKCIELFSDVEKNTSDFGDLDEEFQIDGDYLKLQYTPLLWAIIKGAYYSNKVPELIKLLIKKGANVNKRVDLSLLEGSAISFVCVSFSQHSLEIANILIDAGANKPKEASILATINLSNDREALAEARTQATKLTNLLLQKYIWSDGEKKRIDWWLSDSYKLLRRRIDS